MSKIKYYYDTENCKYEKVVTKPIDIILPILGFLASILIFSFIFTYFQLVQSPSESILRAENEVIEETYEHLEEELAKLNEMIIVLEERDANIYRVITEADSIPALYNNTKTTEYQELAKIGISNDAVNIIRDKVISVEELIEKLHKKTATYENLSKQIKDKNQAFQGIPSIRPCKKYARIASGFGVRIHPILKVRKFHKGIDFAANTGTPIYATGDGVIAQTIRNFGDKGNEIVINHNFGYQTRYGHMQKFTVKAGQKVKCGDLIGYVGNSGNCTTSHLHYELLKNGKYINPVHYFFNDLTPKEYELILEQASEENQSMS